MGFDPMQQDRQIHLIAKVATGPFLIIFGVGKGIHGLVKFLNNNIFKDKEEEKLK